ncbi:hypothetical protein ACIBEJ_11540 [Nonomuraea sp. NPDC050790]|uniref:hypothetical protein n=1 Tax=Nonomuraea sp. NPDC050790 TaxID=3364371 RepID=UPI0037922FA0
MASARRLAAAGALVAFVTGGVSLAIGTAAAETGAESATVSATCLPLPLLPCDEPPGGGEPKDPWSSAPNPMESWSDRPEPEDPWTEGPPPQEEAPKDPWKPVDEDERRVPDGHPETGAGGLAREGAVWPFAVGGAALLTGAGLTGFAVRRREGGA